MSNKTHGHVGYGICLLEDADDEDVPELLMSFGPPDGSWPDAFLSHLYPEGVPAELKIDSHYLKESDRGAGSCEIPLLMIGGFPNYGITSSRDNPDDLSGFFESMTKNRTKWNELIAEFVKRCNQIDFNPADTIPHPVLYISWDR